MVAPKATFSLDAETLRRLDRTAARLGRSKSEIVREAIADYAARAGRLSESERLRLLATFDEVTARIPRRPAAEVEAELAEQHSARRSGGRRRDSGGRG